MPRSTSRSTEPATMRIDGVLVVGGGYAGVHAAIAARHAGAPVTVLDPTGVYDFLPRLASVAAGAMASEDASAPLDEFVDEVLIGRAVHVDDGAVTLEDGRVVGADAVVVTAGAAPLDAPITGLTNALALRTGAQALAMRKAIESTDALVVVGGGATGVQLAASAAAVHPAHAITLVERGPRVLETMSTDLSRRATEILLERGVDLRTDVSVDEVTADGVLLDDGARIDGVVAWTGGVAARADRLGLPTVEDGRVDVDDELRVAGRSATFAAGDIAAHTDRSGRPLPASAQVAVRAGSTAGSNAARLVAGRSTERARLEHLGWVLDLGGGHGVAELGPLPLTTPPIDRLVPLLHGLIDAKHLQEIGGVEAVIRRRTTSTG